MSTRVNPLPSLIRASAEDSANAAMRKAGRTAWSRSDYNTAGKTQERLVRACYGRSADKDQDLCYIRFGVAERFQKDGYIAIDSDWTKVMGAIDELIAGRPVRLVGEVA